MSHYKLAALFLLSLTATANAGWQTILTLSPSVNLGQVVSPTMPDFDVNLCQARLFVEAGPATWSFKTTLQATQVQKQVATNQTQHLYFTFDVNRTMLGLTKIFNSTMLGQYSTAQTNPNPNILPSNIDIILSKMPTGVILGATLRGSLDGGFAPGGIALFALDNGSLANLGLMTVKLQKNCDIK